MRLVLLPVKSFGRTLHSLVYLFKYYNVLYYRYIYIYTDLRSILQSPCSSLRVVPNYYNYARHYIPPFFRVFPYSRSLFVICYFSSKSMFTKQNMNVKSYNCQSLLFTLRFNDNSSVFFVLFLDIVALYLVLDLGYD